MLSAEYIIKKFNLKPLPVEGGFYSQTYRSSERIPKTALPDRYISDRPIGSAIYYLLTPQTCSALHRLKSDEIYHFYLGDPVIMLQLHPSGAARTIELEHDINKGRQLQVVVPKEVWQGSCLQERGKFALLGTTMAPGYDDSDFEPGNRDDLIRRYPEFRELVARLTHQEQT
jgi:hypothetical protein